MRERITKGSVFVAPKGGGYINLVTDDGEVLVTFPLEAGEHGAARYLRYEAPDRFLVPAPEVVVLEPANRLLTDHFGEAAFESAANPHFRVTDAMRQAREMEQRLRRVEALETSLRHQARAMARAKADPPPATPAEPLVVGEPTMPGDPPENSAEQVSAKPGENGTK